MFSLHHFHARQRRVRNFFYNMFERLLFLSYLFHFRATIGHAISLCSFPQLMQKYLNGISVLLSIPDEIESYIFFAPPVPLFS